MENYSVLLTVYKDDNPEYFEIALKSMINQSYPSNDIVIVEDGPVSLLIQKVIDEIMENHSDIIHVIPLETNQGLGLALNEGLKHCKNELVARMDADDISKQNRCQKQVEMFSKNPNLIIVGSPVEEFCGNEHNVVGIRNVPLTNEEIYKYCRRRDPFNHPTVMYKKSKVLEFGPYSNYRKNQDTDLWIKMLSHGVECANYPEPLLYFRFDENTYKKRKSKVNTKLLIEIRKKAWKSGFCSWWDYFVVSLTQIIIYLLPIGFQKMIYRKVLRKNYESKN